MDSISRKISPYDDYLRYLKRLAGPMVGVYIVLYVFQPDLRWYLIYWVIPASLAVLGLNFYVLSRFRKMPEEVRADDRGLSFLKGDQLIVRVPWDDVRSAGIRSFLGLQFWEIHGPEGTIKFNGPSTKCSALEETIREHVSAERLRDPVSMRRSVFITLGILNAMLLIWCLAKRPPLMLGVLIILLMNLVSLVVLFGVRENIR